MIRCNNCGWYNPDNATNCEMCDESLAGVPRIEVPEEVKEDAELPPPHAFSPIPVQEPVPEPKPEVIPESAPAPVREPAPEPPIQHPSQPGNSLKSTIRFSVADENKLEISNPSQSSHCPKCGYPVFGTAEFCPNCGASLKAVSAPAPVAPVAPVASNPIPQSPVAPASTPVSSRFKQTVMENVRPQNPVAEAPAPKSAPAPEPKPEQPKKYVQVAHKPTIRDLKATIREIPAELLDDKAPDANNERTFRLVPIEKKDVKPVRLVIGENISIEGILYRFEEA